MFCKSKRMVSYIPAHRVEHLDPYIQTGDQI